MNRTRCPSCNKRLDNPLLIACPACGVIFTQHEHGRLELLEQQKGLLANEIAEHVKHHLEHVEQEKINLVAEVAKRVPRLLWKQAVAVIFAILTLTGLGVWQGYKLVYTSVTDSARTFISDKIATQFAEPNIKETLNTVAGTHASKIIEDRISPAIEDAQRRIEQARQSLENSFVDTKVRFDLATDFTMTVVAAQSDDRKAFDKLKIWADDKSYPFSSLANNVWLTIIDKHSEPFYKTGFNIPWSEGVDSSKFTLEKLRDIYEHETPAHLKPAIIEFIWNRNDITKKDRMQFFLDVMENDQSLTAVEYAGRFFSAAAQLKTKPMAVEYFVNWWKNNKDKFE